MSVNYYNGIQSWKNYGKMLANFSTAEQSAFFKSFIKEVIDGDLLTYARNDELEKIRDGIDGVDGLTEEEKGFFLFLSGNN